MPKPRPRRANLLLLGLLAGLLVAGGCGRKAPPRPPRAEPLPVVGNLTVGHTGDQVQLSWTSTPLSGRLAQDAQFAIYRDALSLTVGECPTCPPHFQLVAEVPYEPTAARMDAARTGAADTNGGLTFHYTETVAGGYRYRYQVALRLVDGRQGEPSEPVEVTLE
jgi:hypothetical protein